MAHAPEPPPPGTPSYRLIRLGRADHSWMVLPWGQVHVDTSLGSVWKDNNGWWGRTVTSHHSGPYLTRKKAAQWVADKMDAKPGGAR